MPVYSSIETQVPPTNPASPVFASPTSPSLSGAAAPTHAAQAPAPATGQTFCIFVLFKG